MRYIIKTESGSVYKVRSDSDGCYWLSGENVPSFSSVAVPEGEWQIDRPTPWPIAIGQPLQMVSAFYLAFEHPERIPGGGKLTSPVVSVESVEDARI